MKAITLRPWWAWAVVAGGKLVENRSMPYKYRGPIFIHAGVARDPGGEAGLKAILPRATIPEFDDLDRGAIIARAEVIGVIERGGESYVDYRTARREVLPQSQQKWLSPKYRFALVLANIVPVYPVPMKGKLGIWEAGTVRTRKRRSRAAAVVPCQRILRQLPRAYVGRKAKARRPPSSSR
jgi:hypothetical protein